MFEVIEGDRSSRRRDGLPRERSSRKERGLPREMGSRERGVGSRERERESTTRFFELPESAGGSKSDASSPYRCHTHTHTHTEQNVRGGQNQIKVSCVGGNYFSRCYIEEEKKKIPQVSSAAVCKDGGVFVVV